MNNTKVRNLYNRLQRERDKNIDLMKTCKTQEAKNYYDGLAVAYDTVCGWVFAIIGEDEEASDNE